MQIFRQIARILLVGLCFVLFGSICLIGNIFFIPLILLGLHRFRRVQNLSRDIVRYSWRFFLWCAKILGVIKYEYSGFEKLDSRVDSSDSRDSSKDSSLDSHKNPNDSRIFIANHPSLLDVVLIIAKIRRINCVVKADLCKNPFLFAAIKASGYIPNSANEILLQNSLSALNRGESLLIFPEGTRTKDSIIFHKAGSYIAINAAQSLAMIFIKMRPRSLKKGEKWYHTQKMRYSVILRDIWDLQSFAPSKLNPLRVRELHKKLSEIYKEEFKDELS